MHLFTVSDKQTPHLDRLLHSAQVHGHQISILGLGDVYPGHGKKLSSLLEAIQPLEDSEIVLFLDAFDTLILASQEEFLAKYHQFKSPIVFGAESNFYLRKSPNLHLYLRYPKSPTHYRFLNAGTFMGSVWAIKKLLRSLNFSEKTRSDQALFSLYFIHQTQALIALDYHNTLFTCNGGRSSLIDIDYRIEGPRLYNNHTGEYPCVLHVPGRQFKYLDTLTAACGLWTPELNYPETFRLCSINMQQKLAHYLGCDWYLYRQLRLICQVLLGGLILVYLLILR